MATKWIHFTKIMCSTLKKKKGNSSVPRQGGKGRKVLVVSVETPACPVLAVFWAVKLTAVETRCFQSQPLKIQHVFGRAAPAGAVSFGVKHTEGVSVEVACQGQAEVGSAPGSRMQWPLDEGTVLRISMSQASTEVNDNKVRSGVLGCGTSMKGEHPSPTRDLGVCR